jgi:hypothetical protein
MSVRREELIQKMIVLQEGKSIGNFEQINKEYKLFSIMLADEGWYMDYDLAVKTLSGLYLHQVVNNSKVLDEYMINFYKKKLSSIVSFFKNQYLARFPILEKSFKAHRKGYYELSIPVFLTQVEGLFFDLTQKEIFSKGRGKKKDNTAKEWLNSKENNDLDFRIAILEPLKENDNLSANFTEADNFPNALNRNKILHGRDLNYYSELNSYKAISLLLYIGTFVKDIENNEDKLSWI